MFKTHLLAIAIAVVIVPTCLERADAGPVMPNGLAAAVAPASEAQPVYYRRGGVVVGGGGRVVVGRGAFRIGGPAYGGIWYGSCWLASPIGYVWIC
jgi:hypothetical protein